MPAFINSVGVQTRLNEVKASGGDKDFIRNLRASEVLSERKFDGRI